MKNQYWWDKDVSLTAAEDGWDTCDSLNDSQMEDQEPTKELDILFLKRHVILFFFFFFASFTFI